MNDGRERKWPAILFFAASGFFFFGCVWYLYAGTTNPEYYWNQPTAASADQAGSGMKRDGRILLVKNQAVQIDGTRIVYRGTQDGDISMDLFILALDPHYGYPCRIDEDQAREGFSIGEYHFKVLVASDQRISLKRL